MVNNFKNIECGKGSHPYCRFTLNDPLVLPRIGSVYRIDVMLSEDETRYDVWLVSNENGKVYYNAIRKRLGDNENLRSVSELVKDAVEITKDKTLQSRGENFISNDYLMEQLKPIIKEKIRKRLYERLSLIKYSV